MKIANVILEQLGGNRFIAMTGSHNFIDCGDALSMHLSKNKLNAKYLKIKLEKNDLYTVIFSTSKKIMDASIGIKVDQHVILKTINGVYSDMLSNIFESETGLRVSLGIIQK